MTKALPQFDMSLRRLPFVLVLVFIVTTTAQATESSWQAGFARVVITPQRPLWMNGYGGRTAPADGKIHDLYARAAALQDPNGQTVVLVALDVVGISGETSNRIYEAVRKTHPLQRGQIMFSCSHTHCGPALDDRLSHMLRMTEQDWQAVREYQQVFDRKVAQVIQQAIKNLQPAILRTTTGQCGFATNRRVPLGEGPVDHTVPILAAYPRVDGKEPQTPLGIIFGYACHNTTLGIQQWCGDYAGFAALDLEGKYPKSVALFFSGCGADANPLPRRKIELAQMYGRMLALSVEAALGRTKTIQGELTFRYARIILPFATVPSREQLQETLQTTRDHFERQRAKFLLNEAKTLGKVRDSYDYPIQLWQLGDNITWIALGGEVVVDYVIRLKTELPEHNVWVTAYANDVMAYIPSERILAEGGYEGETSMRYYQMPSKWKTGLEAAIVNKVHALVRAARRSSSPTE